MLKIIDNSFMLLKDLINNYPDQEHFVIQTPNGNVYLLSESDIHSCYENNDKHCSCYCLIHQNGEKIIGVTKLHNSALVKIHHGSELKLV